MTVQKWRFEDPSDTNPLTRSYQFTINPNQMDSPYPARSVTTMGTTAVNGQTLMWEGMRQPATLSFGGTILNYEQFEAMRSWVYDRPGRIYLWDHYGRRMTVVLHRFAPEPVRTTGRFRWRHTYTVEATVIDIRTPILTSDEA